MGLCALVLTRIILVASVVLTMLFAVNQVYHVALAFTIALCGYAYLHMWGDLRIEDVL